MTLHILSMSVSRVSDLLKADKQQQHNNNNKNNNVKHLARLLPCTGEIHRVLREKVSEAK